MTFQQVHLSEREQWAQNLKGHLNGMILLADWLARYFDKIDVEGADDLDLILLGIILDGWQVCWVEQLRRMNPEDKAEWVSLKKQARRQYKSKEDFDAAYGEMMVTFFMNEYSPNGTWE